MPKLSVIMPSLNVGNSIRESVSSVLGQTLQDIEILCIDAGSTDGTWEILNELAEADARVHVYHSTLKSYGYQVNQGIRLAKGKYIAVVETDDYIDSGMYKKLYRVAQYYDCDYVKSDYFFYWTQIDKKRFFVKRKMFLDDDIYDRVIEPVRYSEVSSSDWYLWNGIYRTNFVLENQIYFHETPGAAFQDIGFLYYTSIYAKRALYLKDAFYRYCIDREESSSNSGKALEYACQEFRALEEEKEVRRNVDNDTLRALYIRMSRSFIYSYPELDWGNEGEIRETHRLSYSWFQERLRWAIKNRMLTCETVHSEIWSKLCALLESEQNYYERIKKRNENLIRRFGKERKYPIVIFGCGHYGFLAYKWLKKRQYSVVAFMDNDQELWGKTINEIVIRNPEDIALLGNDVRYCVANALYYEDIRKQILQKGIKEEKIVVLE